MKMVTTSTNNLEENSVQKLDNVDQSKGDLKIFPEDLSDSKCHDKDADSFPDDMNHFIKMATPGADCADVQETWIEAGFDDLVKPLGMCDPEKVQSSAQVSCMEFKHSVPQERCREPDGSSIKDICIDEGVLSKDKILVEDLWHQETVAEFEVAADKFIGSRSSTPEISVKKTAEDSRVETSDMKTEPAPSQNPQMTEQQKPASDNLTTSAELIRDHFESSFASVGPYSSSIAYSGAIAYSGSLSHRSDASTVSTRSFAFPVLQNEWNFSPARMRKADRRRLRRHRGWMHGLFCCKF